MYVHNINNGIRIKSISEGRYKKIILEEISTFFS